MDNPQTTVSRESTGLGLRRRGSMVPCVCWLLTHLHGSCCGGKEGNPYISHLKKRSLHQRTGQQDNRISFPSISKKNWARREQLKAWLKPDLLFWSFSKFPSTQQSLLPQLHSALTHLPSSPHSDTTSALLNPPPTGSQGPYGQGPLPYDSFTSEGGDDGTKFLILPLAAVKPWALSPVWTCSFTDLWSFSSSERRLWGTGAFYAWSPPNTS